jgi:hypothetical protein
MSRDRVAQLERAVQLLTMERDALVRQRDFFVEQSRMLQNQVQMWQVMYSGLLKEIARGEVHPDVAAAADLAVQALEAPLTGVEAIRAYMAQESPLTQGTYTGRFALERKSVPGLAKKIRRLGREAKQRGKQP